MVKFSEFLTNSFCSLSKLLYICSPIANPRLRQSDYIEIWCNGSTTDSGSVSEGSNPSISTMSSSDDRPGRVERKGAKAAGNMTRCRHQTTGRAEWNGKAQRPQGSQGICPDVVIRRPAGPGGTERRKGRRGRRGYAPMSSSDDRPGRVERKGAKAAGNIYNRIRRGSSAG